jgi:hypothetical protein
MFVRERTMQQPFVVFTKDPAILKDIIINTVLQSEQHQRYFF